ncbi:FAD-dependent oxidoreductase [Kordiimonas lipolytica]|uniref:FAD-dependent oxidoreductase n=1 Tax=Kordiimonas lipolytica TaxID=1662421 RepID=A0ABV8UE13_9PROT|nr:FAD-dependent oxidoreductase [Kordiimonas lipolytica]
MPYVPPSFPAKVPASVKSGETETTAILVVGAGPIGLATALDLGLRGHRVVVVDRGTQLSDGSRAICYAKRPLEIMDRLGFGEAMVEKGVSWNIGRVFFKDDPEPVYSFDLLPEKDQKFPGMINIQQYYNEEFNIAALEKLDNVDIRWGNEVTGITDGPDGVEVQVETPEGGYRLAAKWLVACDGAHSPTRKMLGMEFLGQTFRDNFLIADVKFKAERPTERHFWFDPPFNPGQSVLLHKQPDDVWRIDFQVGWDIDREEIVKPENVTPRIKAMLGDDIEFEYEWISVYTFNCRQVKNMVHGHVVFAGDSAHLVSPFGARGANTGFQDADNLAWKLDLVLRGKAGEGLIRSYDEERTLAAEINILNSTRSTDFITPKSRASMVFRDATLELAKDQPCVRGFVNSGRLSMPVPYPQSCLNTPDEDAWAGGVTPGTNSIDAPIVVDGEPGWFINQLGWQFKAVIFTGQAGLDPQVRASLKALSDETIPVEVLLVGTGEDEDFPVLNDDTGLLAARLGAEEGSTYLFRPDQYVTARWKQLDAGKIRRARDLATANLGES